jgi:hypothetical protein
MGKKIEYFSCLKSELERINVGLKARHIDADSVVSITDDGDFVTVWYKI